MLRGIDRRRGSGGVRDILRNQDGAVIIMMAVTLAALFCFAVIAIDGSIMQTTKTQLQNAADSAALAGALEYALTGGDQVLAKQKAIDFASYNYAVETNQTPVIITESDISIDVDNKTLTVTTHRSPDDGHPLRLYFLGILGRANWTDIEATATAEVYNVCDVKCVKPWAIPDRWDDSTGPNQGVFDEGEFYDPLLTGYNAPGDIGVQLTLKAGNPNQASVPGHYFPIDLPPLHREIAPLTGADWYREWIATCAPYTVGPGDTCQVEPGNMVGPTNQGVSDLIASDPNATWDSTTQTVINSDYGISPRVIYVPFFFPWTDATSGRTDVIITKIGAFFIESQTSNTVTGRFLQVATPGEPCDDPEYTSFFVGLHLIQNP